MRRDADEQGFTLMELLIVVVVLGVLAGIVVFALGGVSAQAAVAACKSDVSTVQTAVAAYEAQHPGSTVTDIGQLAPNYLHAVPDSPDYTISVASDTVMVSTPTDPTLAASNATPDPCTTAGSGGGGQQAAAVTSTTNPATPAAGGGAATTTTTAPRPTTTTTVAPTTTTTRPPTTTTTTPTTTTPTTNGVTATPTTNTYGGYGGQDILAVSSTKAITALTITIKVAQTTGVTPNGGYNSFPGGIATTTYGAGSGSGTLTSTYLLNSRQSIPAGRPSGSFAAQYGGTGSARVQTGDSWTVVSTSNGVTSTLSGHF
jgi:prepilin-type N-terminal cleavage/methylation domain-containing protein